MLAATTAAVCLAGSHSPASCSRLGSRSTRRPPSFQHRSAASTLPIFSWGLNYRQVLGLKLEPSSCRCPWPQWRRRKRTPRTRTRTTVDVVGLQDRFSATVAAQGSVGTTAPVDKNGNLREVAIAAHSKDEALKWTSVDGEALYRVEGWGSPYFFVSPEGHMCVRLFGCPDGGIGEQGATVPDPVHCAEVAVVYLELPGCHEVDLVEIIQSVKKKNLQLRLVIRFPDILNHRIKLLQDSFDTAIFNYGYESRFQGVFPVKCNHDRFVVEDVVEFGSQCQFGLEAGSKAELLIAMAKLRKSRRALLICNGYKDQVYIENILLAGKLGIKAVVVIEQMEELNMVVKCSKAFGMRPLIGIRAKLSTKHNGHWGNTAGDNGKFGLTVNEVVRVVYTLRHEMLLDCLKLLHFHIGSQIPSICIIREAMREGSQLYCEIALMGAPMGYIDIGGGLGIDYDGTKRQSGVSTDYTQQEYADTVVGTLADACHLKGISQPVIVSESGRALASHHSVLVFEVLSGNQPSEMTALDDLEILAKYSRSKYSISAESSLRSSNTRLLRGEQLLSSFYGIYHSVNKANSRRAFNDAKQFKLDACSLFKSGCLSLEQRAQANALYAAVCHRVLSHGDALDVPEELQSLQKSMAAVYHVNLSLFRSAPDIWAINQIFPIIPLQRLNEKPTVAATLADLTCDSDGKVDHFVASKGGITCTLPVHTLRDGDQYYLGLFLAGVYQEELGSAHNLFGTTNTVHVRAARALKGENPRMAQNGSSVFPNGDDDEQDFTIEHVIVGQTIAKVLSSMHHDVEEMIEELQSELEEAVSDGSMSGEDAQMLLRSYKSSLDSYTYLTR